MLARKATTLFLIVCLGCGLVGSAVASESAGNTSSAGNSVGVLKRQVELLKKRSDEQERQMRQQRELIEALQKKLDQLQNQNKQAAAAEQKVQVRTDQQIEQLQQQVEAGPSPTSFGGLVNSYLGEHRFVLAGGAWGDYFWDRQAGIQGAPAGVNTVNTYNFGTELIPLYQLNDWIGMEGMIDINLPSGGDAQASLEEWNIFFYLNDYLEVVVGKFMLPFGDFMEQVSAPWINRFVTNPLPYGNQMMVSGADVGLEARGGVQWGGLGQDLNYTVWASNGPSFMMAPMAIPGDMINPTTNVTTATNGKGFGERVRAYLFPADSNLGDLEVGASTYDGKWSNGLWFTSWGTDTAYLIGNLELRGEYLETYRQMPSGLGADNRQGWYIQAGYRLNGLARMLPLNPVFASYFSRLEPLIRYSGLNQRAVVLDEVPAPGDFIGPTTFQPHAREVALGLDWWILPSVVWKLEYDMELPEAGGNYTLFAGTPNGITRGAGATYNDRAILSQIAVWF